MIRLSFEEGLSEQVAVLVDDWVLRVGQTLGRFVPAQARQELGFNTITDLQQDARFGVRAGVAWVRHLSGRSTLLDQVPLPVTEIDARFPVTEHLWLTASTACRVSASDTATLIRLGDPWAGLDDFHRMILDFISGIQEHETRTRWTEFQQSLVHDAAVVESVATRLAATVEETAVKAVAVDADPLVIACQVVAEALGIDVRDSQKGRDRELRATYATRWETSPGPPVFTCVRSRSRTVGGAVVETNRCLVS